MEDSQEAPFIILQNHRHRRPPSTVIMFPPQSPRLQLGSLTLPQIYWWLDSLKALNQDFQKLNYVATSVDNGHTQYLYLKCRYKGCQASIGFKRPLDLLCQKGKSKEKEDKGRGGFVLGRVRGRHVHYQGGFWEEDEEEEKEKEKGGKKGVKGVKGVKEDVEVGFYHSGVSVKLAVEFLKKKQYMLFMSSEEKIFSDMQVPNILVAISPEMAKNYEYFGKCLHINIFTNLLRGNPDFKFSNGIYEFNYPLEQIRREQKQFSLVVFSGFNHIGEIIPFGLATLSQKCQTQFSLVMSQFFKLQTCPITTTIVTPQDPIYSKSILQIQNQCSSFYTQFTEKITHLTDIGHFIDNAQGFKQCDKVLMKKIKKDILFAYTNEQVQRGIEKIALLAPQQQRILKSMLLSQIDKSKFVSHFPQVFCNAMWKQSSHDKLVDILKLEQKSCYPYFTFLEFFDSQMNQKSISPSYTIPKLFQDKTAELIKEAQSNFVYSLGGDKYRIQVNKSSVNGKKVIYFVQQQNLQKIKSDFMYLCSCGFIQKCHFLCSHAISVIMAKGENVEKVLNRQWCLLWAKKIQIPEEQQYNLKIQDTYPCNRNHTVNEIKEEYIYIQN